MYTGYFLRRCKEKGGEMSSWLVALLFLLALGVQCLSQTCNSTITILITGNDSRTLPMNNTLFLETNLSLPITWTFDDQVRLRCTNETRCMYPGSLSHGDMFNIRVTNGTLGFLLIITVDVDEVVCQFLTVGILLPSNLTMSCIPVASCNNTSEQISDYYWQIQHVRSDTMWYTLQRGQYTPPESTGLVSDEGDNMVDISEGGMTLEITSMTRAMIGYYRVKGGDRVLSNFTVFLRVTFEDTYRLSVNVVEGRDEIFIPCRYESFPPVFVTWQRVLEDSNTMILDDFNISKYTFVNINETENDIEDIGEHFDVTLTLNGGLIIHDVVVEDYGTYMCIASNGFASTTESLIFRVRSRLRPLWPALGIIGVFIITGMFIFASYCFDRLKEEKQRSIEPSEIDGEQEAAFRERPSIISIENEDENSTVQKRAHTDGYTK